MLAAGYAFIDGRRVSLLCRYDGTNWMKINTDGLNMNLYRIRKEESKNRYYMHGFITDNVHPDSNAAVVYENGRLELIDKEEYSNTGSITI